MAGELSTLGRIGSTQIGTLAAVEGLALSLFVSDRSSDDSTSWRDLMSSSRNHYRLLAARLMIEHHNEAPDIDRMVTPDRMHIEVPLDDSVPPS